MPANTAEGESVVKDEKRDAPEVAVVSQEAMAAQAAIDSAAEADDAAKATMLAEQIKGGVAADLTEEEKMLNESRDNYAQGAQKVASQLNDHTGRSKLRLMFNKLLHRGYISKEAVMREDANRENERFDAEER